MIRYNIRKYPPKKRRSRSITVFSDNNRRKETIWKGLIILLLAGFLCCGLLTFRDYGASSDERNQITAGHITWKAICTHFGKAAPAFDGLPDVKDYYNRYYGQAATFPTVLVEAAKGFSMDVSTILRMRRLWNFGMFWLGTVCFGVLLHLRFRRSDTVFFTLLIYILTPRLFGDAFYNDRDVLLISLLWMALLCFESFQRKPGVITALICGFFFALAINTRFFALVLIFLPIIRLFRTDRRTKICSALILILTFFFWYLMTPVFWGSFISEFTAALRTFASGKQRTQETNGAAQILFFGKHFRENDLPFYYLPLWIFISTPLVTQILAAAGLLTVFRGKADLTDRFMQILLCAGVAAVMLIRPVLYNGWRHFYFFYVPLFRFVGHGVNKLMQTSRRTFLTAGVLLILCSAGLTAWQMKTLHPYEYIYLNPLFRAHTAGFDRDYWRLSTTECLEWIGSRESGITGVGEINENLDNSLIGLQPGLRSRISIRQYNSFHRFPSDYLIFNYSESVGNKTEFPLYEPVFAVERDHVKLSEVFRRIPSIQPEIAGLTPDVRAIADGDLNTEWRSSGLQDPDEALVIEFAEITSLCGLSLLPGDDEREFARSPEVSVSADGESWQVLPLTVSGLFDLSFPQTETKWLRICNTESADVHWSIREVLFY